MENNLVTLTSDFGASYYVGEMKGVVKRVNPKAEVVDITHNVSRHSIVEGAFILSRAWRHFPKNTVHVAVVDPGVGSGRKAVAVETENATFIGPDNGILRWALKDETIVRSVELDAAVIRERAGVVADSATFHGRDVFAPAAALLTRGVDLDFLGKRAEDLAPLEIKPDTIVHIDGFGNIITTCAFGLRPGGKVRVVHKGSRYEARVVKTYAEAEPGRLIALIGSHGFIEVDVNQGDAARLLGAFVGDRIALEQAA